jgi:oxazoline/thiazoline synthase
VPARFDASQPIDWVPCSSLISGEMRWLPAAYCYYGYGASDVSGYRGEPYCVADSNGCAAGNTVEEAILQALLELLERDACALAWYSRAQRPEIELEGFDGMPFATLREAFAARGRELRVLDLRTDTRVPVAMAVAWNREDGLATTFALGCHLDPRIAVSRALSELAQLAAGESDPAASIHDLPGLAPAPVAPVRAVDLPVLSGPDIAEEIHWCCDVLAGLGHDVLVLDQTRPEVGFPVVRVVVPGLRHFWRRLAPGRLYDTPVKLGWLNTPLREDELNPVAVLI